MNSVFLSLPEVLRPHPLFGFCPLFLPISGPGNSQSPSLGDQRPGVLSTVPFWINSLFDEAQI